MVSYGIKLEFYPPKMFKCKSRLRATIAVLLRHTTATKIEIINAILETFKSTNSKKTTFLGYIKKIQSV